MEVQFYPNNDCFIKGGAKWTKTQRRMQQTILHEQPVTGNWRASLQQSLGRYKSKTEDEIEQDGKAGPNSGGSYGNHMAMVRFDIMQREIRKQGSTLLLIIWMGHLFYIRQSCKLLNSKWAFVLRLEKVHSCLYHTASWFRWPLGQGDDRDEKKMVFLVESTHKGIAPDRQYLKWKLVNLYSKRDIRDNENK